MITSAATPAIRLVDIDLPSILSEASVGRMPASQLPGLIAKALADPDPADMFMQMFHLLQPAGQYAFALDMQAKALQRRCLFRVAGTPAPAIRVLALMGPGDANMPIDFVVENTDVRLDLLFLLPGQALPADIPDHDVAIVAVRESEENRPLLARLDALLAVWPRPVLNHPRHIARCARDTACRLLANIPGLLTPETRRLERGKIRGSRFPVTIRPLDTHGGKGLVKLNTADELDAYLDACADAEFYIADYVEYRDEDGLYRKYRIALIDGRPYVCHLAISDNWMVHYLPAGMRASPHKRAEEAATMESFDHDFAIRHRAALDAIADRLGLDYVILDCGETRDGRLLWFEADNAGWIHAADPVDIFPYKPRVMQKAFDAFRTMLAKRAALRQEP